MMEPSDSNLRITTEDGWPCFHEHSLLEAAVKEATRELQVSREMALMCAFGAMATACQANVNVRMPTGHEVPTSLMLLTIAESGERKTTTQKYFFEAINELNSTAYQANEEALQQYRVDHQLWITRRRHLERMYSKHASQDSDTANDTLETIARHVRSEPQPAQSGKFLYEDTTPQALIQMLYENTPHGCLLTSEANSIFSGKALGELDKINTLWDGGDVIVDRVSRDGFILKNARLTLSLMAQPSVIENFMSKRGAEARGTGFLARFLVAKPRPLAGQREPITLSELPRQKAFNSQIHKCMTTLPLHAPKTLRFSEAASEYWLMKSRYLEEEMQENRLYYYLKDHASKLLENATRLAAIVHRFEPAQTSDEINIATLEFCWKFAETCSKHFIEQLASEPQIVTDVQSLTNYLLKRAINNEPETRNRTNQSDRHYTGSPPSHFIKGAETNFTLSDLKQRGPGSLRGRANNARLEAALNLLKKLGHLEKKGGTYNFRETILIKLGTPEIKNGTTITIKNLPLFSEQTHWNPQRSKGNHNYEGYYLDLQKT